MKVAISAKGNNLDSAVERNLKRTPFYLIVDTETLNFESIPAKIQYDNLEGKVQIAKIFGDKHVDAVLTGPCENEILQIFHKHNIIVSETAGENVKEQVNSFIKHQFNANQYSNRFANIPFWVVNSTKNNI